MVFVTGDTHGIFDRIVDICISEDTTVDDVIVILGDVALNFHGEPHDWDLKEEINEYSITLLCIHGNHEMRPESIPSYEEIEWRGGIVYCEPEFPNLLFAKDGEIYDLEGHSCIAIGGANSIDKHMRVAGIDWWPDEQPSDFIKDRVEERLDREKWKVDIVFSHTCPFSYMPVTPFSFGDNSTEEWLDTIENRLSYKRWYCGHFHSDHSVGDIKFMYHDYMELW